MTSLPSAAVSGRRGELVIRGGWIVPMRGPPIRGGAVRIRGSRVVAVSAGAVAARERASRMVDLPDAVVMPGLVNAHTHLEFSDMEAPLDAAGTFPETRGLTPSRSLPIGAKDNPCPRLNSLLPKNWQFRPIRA